MSSTRSPCIDSLCYALMSDALATMAAANERLEKAKCGLASIVFACTCLEAYINGAWESLLGQPPSRRKPLRDKWLELPAKCGASSTFDTHADPFRTFEKLLHIRNKLVHFKPWHERLEDPPRGEQKDRYLLDVLTDEQTCRRLCACVNGMVERLCELSDGRATTPSYFDCDPGRWPVERLTFDAQFPVEWTQRVKT